MEQIKDKFIIFPKLDSKHINIIVFVISSLLRVVATNLIIQTDFASIENDENHSFFKEICYFDMLTNFIGDISVGFYKIITIFGNKQNQNPNPSTSVEEKTKTAEDVKEKKTVVKKAANFNDKIPVPTAEPKILLKLLRPKAQANKIPPKRKNPVFRKSFPNIVFLSL